MSNAYIKFQNPSIPKISQNLDVRTDERTKYGQMDMPKAICLPNFVGGWGHKNGIMIT